MYIYKDLVGFNERSWSKKKYSKFLGTCKNYIFI